MWCVLWCGMAWRGVVYGVVWSSARALRCDGGGDLICTFSNVVMARVAIERLGSEIRASMSSLHLTMAIGWRIETSLRQRMAA